MERKKRKQEENVLSALTIMMGEIGHHLIIGDEKEKEVFI